MNTLPWGGPTARAATALKVDAADIFVPKPLSEPLVVGDVRMQQLHCHGATERGVSAPPDLAHASSGDARLETVAASADGDHGLITASITALAISARRARCQ